VRPDEVDAGRLEHVLQEGRPLIDTDPSAASVAIGEALALWRGRPFEDFSYESFTQAEITRLEELRLEAVELRVDADLPRGLTAELCRHRDPSYAWAADRSIEVQPNQRPPVPP
jgi:hypothetical protein